MMNKKISLYIILRRFAFLSLLLLTTYTLALAERHERLVDSWRPVHYDITLALNDQLTEITNARALISVQILKGPLNVLDLDFGTMIVDSVTVGNTTTRFEQSSGKLNVQLP